MYKKKSEGFDMVSMPTIHHASNFCDTDERKKNQFQQKKRVSLPSKKTASFAQNNGLFLHAFAGNLLSESTIIR